MLAGYPAQKSGATEQKGRGSIGQNIITMKSHIFYLPVLCCFLAWGCSKKDKDTPADGASKPLLRRIEWDPAFAINAELHYNNDSSLQKMLFTASIGTDEITFTRNSNKQVSLISSSRSQRDAAYRYDNKGLVTGISMTSVYHNTELLYEFTYTAGGRVEKLDYSIINEAGKTLQWRSLYEYQANGLLNKIVATSKDNAVLTYTFENYSDSCDLDPWAFISHVSVEEMYQLFNYPVMSTMHRFPGKITTSNGAGAVQKIVENTCTIQQQLLRKMNIKKVYPTIDQYDVSYFY